MAWHDGNLLDGRPIKCEIIGFSLEFGNFFHNFNEIYLKKGISMVLNCTQALPVAISLVCESQPRHITISTINFLLIWLSFDS